MDLREIRLTIERSSNLSHCRHAVLNTPSAQQIILDYTHTARTKKKEEGTHMNSPLILSLPLTPSYFLIIICIIRCLFVPEKKTKTFVTRRTLLRRKRKKTANEWKKKYKMKRAAGKDWIAPEKKRKNSSKLHVLCLQSTLETAETFSQTLFSIKKKNLVLITHAQEAEN